MLLLPMLNANKSDVVSDYDIGLISGSIDYMYSIFTPRATISQMVDLTPLINQGALI